MAEKIKAGFWKSLFTLKHLYYLIIGAFTTVFSNGCLYGVEPLYGVAPDYGMPMATLTLNGKILEANTGDGLPNIEVQAYSLYHANDTTYQQIVDIDTTDAQGNYSLKVNDMITDSLQVAIVATDLDKTFQEKDTLITFRESGLTGGDGYWDQGSTDTTINMDLNK